MTRAGQLLAGALVLVTVCMAIALVGRSGDWSPFALVCLGAAAGVLFGGAATIVLWGVDE